MIRSTTAAAAAAVIVRALLFPFVSWLPKRNQDEPLYQAIDPYQTGAWDEPIDLYQAAAARTSQSIDRYEAVGADAWDVGLRDGVSLGLEHHRVAVGTQEIFFRHTDAAALSFLSLAHFLSLLTRRRGHPRQPHLLPSPRRVTFL
jgi:hypothetical protein